MPRSALVPRGSSRPAFAPVGVHREMSTCPARIVARVATWPSASAPPTGKVILDFRQVSFSCPGSMTLQSARYPRNQAAIIEASSSAPFSRRRWNQNSSGSSARASVPRPNGQHGRGEAATRRSMPTMAPAFGQAHARTPALLSWAGSAFRGRCDIVQRRACRACRAPPRSSIRSSGLFIADGRVGRDSSIVRSGPAHSTTGRTKLNILPKPAPHNFQERVVGNRFMGSSRGEIRIIQAAPFHACQVRGISLNTECARIY